MKQDKLLEQLIDLINKYIEDLSIKKEILDSIHPDKIKYVLAEFEKHKKNALTKEERNLIKNIYFHYC